MTPSKKSKRAGTKPGTGRAANKAKTPKPQASKPASARKTAAEKTSAKKIASKKAPAKRSALKKTPAKKSAAPTTPHEGPWAEAFAPRATGERRYWLVKSEPETFSFDDLVAAPNGTTFWNGVRNFAARNFMRDGMKVGDQIFFYHSSTKPQAIVGICEVVRESYADFTAFDPTQGGHDPESDPDDPTWFMVDVRAVGPLARPVTLTELKEEPALTKMALLRIGRLSVTPVRADEWDVIQRMAR